MSAALDDLYGEVPVFVLPEHVRRRAAMRLVPIDRRRAPSADWSPITLAGASARPRTFERPVPALTRLTRRGIAVLAVAVGVLAAAVIGLAWLSAPSAAAPAPAVHGNSVVVSAGDSLWSIAGRVAPGRDPRAEVVVLQRLNRLGAGASLVPGQVLRVH